jgi:glycosyltransferase involved in cell wall biosynthesis
LLAWLFTSFRKEVESGRVVLGVETHATRLALESLIGIRVTYLPHPVDAKPVWRKSRGNSGEKSSKCEDVLTTEGTEGEQGRAQETCDGAKFSNPSTSELALDSENTALIRSADAPSSSPVTTQSLLATTPEASLPSTSYAPPATSAKPIVFGCYGAARWEKGSDIFQEAIRLVLDGAISTTKCTKGHEKGEGISTTDNSDIHGRGDAGLCLDKPSGAASGYAEALRAETRKMAGTRGNQLADSMEFLKGHSQAGLQMDSQKDRSIPLANDPSASEKNSESVSISEICGQNSSSTETSHSTLDALRFVIQWVEDFRDGEGNLVSIDPWLREHPQVEVIGRYFQGDEYDEQLEQTDVMVLPYRSPYMLRVSRVVIEAMIHGMPVIATKSTTLFEQAQEFGTVVACDGADAKSLAEAIWNLVTDFERMQHEALGKSEIARTNFSVKYFRELLIKCSSPSLHFFKNN